LATPESSDVSFDSFLATLEDEITTIVTQDFEVQSTAIELFVLPVNSQNEAVKYTFIYEGWETNSSSDVWIRKSTKIAIRVQLTFSRGGCNSYNTPSKYYDHVLCFEPSNELVILIFLYLVLQNEHI